jgi:hypothetical protein
MSISNTDFLKFLDLCLEAGIETHVCFSSNSPLESRETFKETLRLIEKIIIDKKITNVFCGNYSLEPASPIYLHRDKYGITSKVRGFKDYYNMLKKHQNVGPFGFTAPSAYRTRTLSEKDALALTGMAYKTIGEAASRLNARSTQYSFY